METSAESDVSRKGAVFGSAGKDDPRVGTDALSVDRS
jgi:hypothetical protein